MVYRVPNRPESDRKWRAAAYHEAGHAIAAYYYGCSIKEIRIFEQAGRINGATKIPEHVHQAEIAAAGRACAEAFGFEQSDLDTAHDDMILSDILSEDSSPDDEDHVFEARIAEIRSKGAALF